MLTGQMVDAHYIAEAVRLVRSVEGVTAVESISLLSASSPLNFDKAEARS